jgi:hypothetical protein
MIDRSNNILTRSQTSGTRQSSLSALGHRDRVYDLTRSASPKKQENIPYAIEQ